MTRRILGLNAITHFKGSYIDDNRQPAKERRHLSIEKDGDYLFFIKFTSEKREELSQVRLKPDSIECLDMVSYPVFNRKVKISLTDLKTTKHRHFNICSLHSSGCLKTKKFAEICRAFKEVWENELTPESEKKIITLKASELKPTTGIPLMSRMHKFRQCKHCTKLRSFCFWYSALLFTFFLLFYLIYILKFNKII